MAEQDEDEDDEESDEGEDSDEDPQLFDTLWDLLETEDREAEESSSLPASSGRLRDGHENHRLLGTISDAAQPRRQVPLEDTFSRRITVLAHATAASSLQSPAVSSSRLQSDHAATNSFQWPLAFDYTSGDGSPAAAPSTIANSSTSPPTLEALQGRLPEDATQPAQSSCTLLSYICEDMFVTQSWQRPRYVTLSVANVHIHARPAFSEASELSFEKFVSRLRYHGIRVGPLEEVVLNGYEVSDQVTFERVIERATKAEMQRQRPVDPNSGGPTIVLECRALLQPGIWRECDREPDAWKESRSGTD